MVELAGAWSEGQLETFLETSTIPIRIATQRGDGSLWLVTLWYRYRDGAFDCATWANADVVRFLRNDSEVAFEVSTNSPPYRGVRGNGTAAMSRDGGKETLRALMERYLGGTDSSLGRWLLDDAREEIHIRIHPDELYTWDYSDRMEGLESPTA
ncbi:MAG: pyridoxamine 5'-phosphate oxidase family protein [Haloferacaceae archaeon]